MVQLYLVRHAETGEGTDPGLSLKGKQQAKRVAERLASLPITKAYVSSARRTVETYEAYRQLRPEVPSVVSEQLKEIYRVIIGGPERPGTSPKRKDEDTKRSEEVLQDLFDHAKDDALVLFTHGNLIRYLLAHFLKLSKDELWERLEIHEASISLIEITNNESSVKLIDSIEHLGEEEITLHPVLEYLS